MSLLYLPRAGQSERAGVVHVEGADIGKRSLSHHLVEGRMELDADPSSFYRHSAIIKLISVEATIHNDKGIHLHSVDRRLQT